MAVDILPLIAEIRRLHRQEMGLARSVRDAVQAAVASGVPTWTAYAITVEGDWR
jgi:hypothetical protein